MCVIHISVRCSDRFSELLVGDVMGTELTIESVVGTALLEIFDTVQVEGVTLFTPQSAMIDGGERESDKHARGST